MTCIDWVETFTNLTERYSLCTLYSYKITRKVCVLWLAERRVCMRVCKHGCDIKMFCFSPSNHVSTNLKKGFELKHSTSLLYLPTSLSVETWKIFRNMLCQFFSLDLTFWVRKTRILESIFFAKQRLITRTSFVYKTLRLVRISLLINALNKEVLLFFSGKLFYKCNRNLFSCVCISWCKQSRGWENSRQLCKPSTLSLVSITVSKLSQPFSCLYQAMQMRKHFLLLK